MPPAGPLCLQRRVLHGWQLERRGHVVGRRRDHRLGVGEHCCHEDIDVEVDVIAAKRIGQRDGGFFEAEEDEADDEVDGDGHRRAKLDHRVPTHQQVERQHQRERVEVRERDRLCHRVDDVGAVPSQRERLCLEGAERGAGGLLRVGGEVLRDRAHRPHLAQERLEAAVRLELGDLLLRQQRRRHEHHPLLVGDELAAVAGAAGELEVKHVHRRHH
mmetsp:Transcript_11867/g.29803  ORF Transcript_11867/g.29803 Transcript_11867/m.29803 type:complete len:216 (-) Transcript_11867:97-744(-)